MAFQPVEDALHDAFLPALLKGGTYPISGRAVTSLPVKQSRIALPDPTETAGAKLDGVMCHHRTFCCSAPWDG